MSVPHFQILTLVNREWVFAGGRRNSNGKVSYCTIDFIFTCVLFLGCDAPRPLRGFRAETPPTSFQGGGGNKRPRKRKKPWPPPDGDGGERRPPFQEDRSNNHESNWIPHSQQQIQPHWGSVVTQQEPPRNGPRWGCRQQSPGSTQHQHILQEPILNRNHFIM